MSYRNAFRSAPQWSLLTAICLLAVGGCPTAETGPQGGSALQGPVAAAAREGLPPGIFSGQETISQQIIVDGLPGTQETTDTQTVVIDDDGMPLYGTPGSPLHEGYERSYRDPTGGGFVITYSAPSVSDNRLFVSFVISWQMHRAGGIVVEMTGAGTEVYTATDENTIETSYHHHLSGVDNQGHVYIMDLWRESTLTK